MRLRSIIFKLVFVVILAMIVLPTVSVKALDIINGHNVVLDGSGKIIPWTPDPTQEKDLHGLDLIGLVKMQQLFVQRRLNTLQQLTKLQIRQSQKRV